jgi:hypothetical protein
MSYTVLSGRLCNVNVLNVYARTENKRDDTKAGFYQELEGVPEKVPYVLNDNCVKRLHY